MATTNYAQNYTPINQNVYDPFSYIPATSAYDNSADILNKKMEKQNNVVDVQAAAKSSTPIAPVKTAQEPEAGSETQKGALLGTSISPGMGTAIGAGVGLISDLTKQRAARKQAARDAEAGRHKMHIEVRDQASSRKQAAMANMLAGMRR